MISTKQRFKQNEIGNWHAPTKHELSHSTVKPVRPFFRPL